MYRYTIRPLGNRYFQQSVFRPLFTPDECDRVLESVAQQPWGDALVTNAEATGGYDAKVRSAKVGMIPHEATWIFDRLVEAIGDINSEVFRFRLSGLPVSDAPSVLRYDADRADHFRPHSDAGPEHCTRRLTYVVQLTGSDQYTGGDLVLKEEGVHAPRDQGTLIAFPSTLQHIVTPVMSGTRHVVVGWVHGPTLT